MRLDKRGMTGLFDALIFLSVASVVSVALLSAMCGDDWTHDGGEHEGIEAAHLVLLRSTMVDAFNNSYSVKELFELEKYREESHRENISAIFDLLLPGMEWSWTVSDERRSYHLGSPPDHGGDVFCSIIRSPWDGGEIMFKLEVWSV